MYRYIMQKLHRRWPAARAGRGSRPLVTALQLLSPVQRLPIRHQHPCCWLCSAVMSDSTDDWRGALCRFQNCLWLLEEQNLRRLVGLKVLRRQQPGPDGIQYLIIIHVRADKVFSQYFHVASEADLPLFRGMFMAMSVSSELLSNDSTADTPIITNCAVHQAFLPKFENETQDAAIASSILAESNQRYMLVTVKHSGSLATLSYNLMGAKNSQGNIYTAVAILLLKAHYQRVAVSAGVEPEQLMSKLFEAMQSGRVSVSFETVARCLSHHGQLPAGEYMVVTSVTRLHADGTLEVLPWVDHLEFCAAHHLPVNDAWLFAGTAAAAAAATALDTAANAALPTASALAMLDAVVDSHSLKAIRICGTYPHDAWQGTRVEGFVIAQGAPLDDCTASRLQELAASLRGATLPRGDAGGDMASASHEADAARDPCFAESVLRAVQVPRGADRGGGNPEDIKQKLEAGLQSAAPDVKFLMGDWVSASDGERDALCRLAASQQLPLQDSVCLRLSGSGDRIPSRQAVAAASQDALRNLAGNSSKLQQLLAVAGPPGRASEVASSPRPSAGGTFLRFRLNEAMQELAGPLLRSRGLRYKKKMWSFRTAAEALPPALAIPPPHASDGTIPGDSGQLHPTTSSTGAEQARRRSAAAGKKCVGTAGAAGGAGGEGRGGGGGGHVAYCMMTFIIRNGIRQLREGEAAYEGYVAALVKRWGLPAEQSRRVKEFGRCWAAWVRAGGHLGRLRESLYLDTAEVFVQEFLAGTASSGAGSADLTASCAAPHQAAALRRSASGGSSAGSEAGNSRSLRRSGGGSGGSGGSTSRSGGGRGSKKARRHAGPGSHRSSGEISRASSGGSVGGGGRSGGGAAGGRDSNSCSDTSLTALAGHCPLRSGACFRGLALLGFSEEEVQEVAQRAGASGSGAVAGGAAGVEQGWVAGLTQVPPASDAQFWAEAVHGMKVVVRSSQTAALPDATADKDSTSGTWRLPPFMAEALPSDVIEPYFQQRIARFGPGWLQARWLSVGSNSTAEAVAPAATSSGGGLHDASATAAGELMGRNSKGLLVSDIPRGSPEGSRSKVASPEEVHNAKPGSQVAQPGGCTGEGQEQDSLAQVIAWLGSGASPKDTSRPHSRHGTASTRNDPCLVVTFVSTPGLGKTAICEALRQRLDPARYHVVHHHSDALPLPQRKRFWPFVNSIALTRRGDGRATVVLADKNLLDSPAGNWDKTAATINAPVLAVLLTDTASAAPFVLPPFPPPAAGDRHTEPTDPPAAHAAHAASAGAAASLAQQELSKLSVSGCGGGGGGGATDAGGVSAAAMPATAGGKAPFSMEQYALAMLRVIRRPDHVGQLDSRQPEALRIMCGFGGTFRRFSPAAAINGLRATFPHAVALPVCRATSSAPPPPPAKHRELMDLVCQGFRKGRFGKGPGGYGVPPGWEDRVRTMLRDDDVERFLQGFALPLDDIAADLAAAIDRTLAAEAESDVATSGAGTGSTETQGRAAQPPSAVQAKLERCVYVAVGGFSRRVVAAAFAQAQQLAADGGAEHDAMHVAKDELHVTLWHAADGSQQRGLACVAAEGAAVTFDVTGFDVSQTLSAARVVWVASGADQPALSGAGAAVGEQHDDVLAVELPHITMHVGRGEKAVNARWLQQQHALGDSSVRWLPLPEPLRLTGQIQVVSKPR
eukprot:jgi/Ulvmu1/1735/UM117_0012.1